MDYWICVDVNNRYINEKNIEGSIRKELGDIFGKDLLDIAFINISSDNVDLDNSYIFIKCNNYDNYIEKLIESRIVFDVLGGYKSPDIISNKEVKSFTFSVQKTTEKQLKSGDVVLIRSGYLKNIYGVIIKNVEKKYEVLFKLYTHCFTRKMKKENLKYVGENIFDKISDLI